MRCIKIIAALFFLFSLASCKCVAQNSKDNSVQVVLLAGQSNMAGHGNYDALDDELKLRLKKVANRVFLSTSDNPKNEPIPLSYYTASSNKYNFNKHFGPELFIGLTLAEANPDQEFLLIKKAVGGTSLYGAWNPNWSQEKANIAERGDERKQLKLFSAHIANIKHNLNRLQSQGKSYQILGLAWMQGESDTNKEITASSYKSNIKNLISEYRTELSLPNLPFVLGQVNVLPRKYKVGPEQVRQAVEAVSKEDRFVSIVKTSTNPDWLDFPKHSDNLHYNVEGQKRLGAAFGEKLLEYSEKDNQPEEIQVVLLAGQSNMAGAGNFDNLSNSDIKRIKQIANRVSLSFNGKPSKPLSYYDNKPSEKYQFLKRFGPELFMGLTLAEENPSKHYLLIKRSQGGTALYGAWNPNWTAEKAKEIEKGFKQDLKLYNLHIADIKRNLKELKNQGKNYKIIGMAWMQGENDAVLEAAAKGYKDNLIKLVSAYRTEFNVPEMPFVLGQINSRYGIDGGAEMVRKNMMKFVNQDYYSELIKTSTDTSWSDYPKHDDNVHYNAEGSKRLGIAFATQLIKLQK